MKYLVLSLLTFLFISEGVSYAQNTNNRLKQQAETHLAQGKLGEAIELLNKYISASPEEPDGYNLRGTAYEKRGNYDAALRDYTSASKLQPENKEIKNNYKRAREAWDILLVNRIEGYKREIAIDPAPPRNYLEIARAYNNLEDWPTSELWYDEYLKREEASPDDILRYTEVLMKNEKYRKGEPILKKYTINFPRDHRIWSRYGYFNLWLGNRAKAITAFEEALKIRPFFKEAMEGLDQAKGKGYNYTYTSRGKGKKDFPIDRYFNQLKVNPENDSIRLLLVKELISHKRIEEAYQQLQILQPDSASVENFSTLWTEVTSERKKIHLQTIDDLKIKYEKNPVDQNVLLKLARHYSYIEDYDSSGMFYQKYLKLSPGDINARFEYAKVLAWNLDYNAAKEQVSLLLTLQPENKEYQLLYAVLSVWMLQDLDKAEEYLKGILADDPNNLEAMISFISLSIQKKDFDTAERMLQQAKTIDPGNERLAKLESDLDFNKLRAEEERIFLLLEEGRVTAMENKCKEALVLYDQYLQYTDPNRMVLREYGDVNACAGNYKKAIEIYNKLLEEEYDFETDLQRAKVYYWSGDSLSALKEFERLYASHPENFDVKMYLGDTYTKLKMYADARRVYNQLLGSSLDSTQTELITLRMGWLPIGREGFGKFLNYVMLTPSVLYYEDNIGFAYNAQSLRLDLGLTDFLTIAPEVSTGLIKSDLLRSRFTAFKGNLLLRLSDRITAGGSAGITEFQNYQDGVTADGFIKYEKPENYLAAFSILYQDAAFVLYSPHLVNRRLYATLFKLEGFYRFRSGIKLSGYATHAEVSNRNRGEYLELEAGKYFTDRLYTAYEFYYINYEQTSALYFSPEHYSSHSIIAEYDFVKEKVNRLTLGGKLGIIAGSDYILKEVFAAGMYGIFSNLALQGRISYGSTLQNDLGYSSFSVQLAAYWLF